MTRPYHYWTMGDILILYAHYPAGGARECMKHLPTFTSKSIREQAAKWGIKYTGSMRFV